MIQQGFTPYLPSWEYIADSEPHVFGNRVYLFGSHDKFGGKKFCENNYVCWSASVEELSNWKCEGVIYRKEQDPDNRDGKRQMWAPDVTQGPDGRFYLYYCLSGDHGDIPVSIAVCDTPCGNYEFYGHVQDKTGARLGCRAGDKTAFDPAVLVDDGRIWLYCGNGPQQFCPDKENRKASLCVELESDMRTMRTEPKSLIPTLHNAEGTEFAGHEFFEASSIRKFGEKYYFIYSTVHCHELVYAVSNRPDGDFHYAGVLISNGDLRSEDGVTMALNSRPNPKVKAYMGNNHGSIVEIKGKYYIFYHRHTNRNLHTRQSCAQQIQMDKTGHFYQAELNSRGFTNGALPGVGRYEARIACHLYSKKGAMFSAHPLVQNRKHPALTQEGKAESAVQYIENIRDGATVGFRDFHFHNTEAITVIVRGKCRGSLIVSDGTRTVAKIQVSTSNNWKDFIAPIDIQNGDYPLYFTYQGRGALDFLAFTLSERSKIDEENRI